ncbi:MAG: molybdopterin-dependent oxidoreductase [Spirochaetaceae bacterium]|nr:molybdopterin-dependent oxidoreductase [Myxococcales bacterium]MCB9723128.1 molybdopterin-dependent oxidoreductase [Spirochaetaceae bacterium]
MKTFCRLCEVNCGLEAVVDEGGRLADLRPDRAHPVTAGFACHKGLLAREIHHDPDRLDHPQRRIDGGFERTSWDEALPAIASRLERLLAEHGPRSVALYMGNPSAFNAVGSMATGLFAASLGIERLFNAGTQDCANKFVIGEILYGSAEIHPVADLDHAQYVLLIGTNPRVSQLSFLSTPDPVGTLRAARRRGARLVFVNPLALDDLADVGETVQIRPDTDAYLLAAMIHEIDRDPDLGFDERALRNVRGIDRLRAFVARHPAERVAAVVGTPAERIRAMARDFARAEGAAIHVSTGVNMGRQGTLAYYLAQMLSLVTGNLDRRGGNVLPARGVPPMTLPPEASAPRLTRWGGYRPARGTPPGSLLADMIRDDDEPIRALFVVAGNPVLSIGGGPKLERALASLELLVSIDYYRNATGELAHWALPATDWFEREDLNYFVQGVQRRPYLQWTPAVVPARGERRPEAWILSRVLQEMGRPSLLDLPGDDWLTTLWDGRLAETGHSIDALRRAEGNVVVLPEATPGGFLERIAPGGVFDACPAALDETLDRAEPIFLELAGEPSGGLKLITRRTPWMLNSGFQNVKVLRETKGGRTNPLFMNPRDALERGLVAGQSVVVRNEHGELRAELALDERLREGVVAMSHGFGNRRTTGMPVAMALPGVNVNALSPTGEGSFDPVGGMGRLTGIRVEVEAA